MQGDLHPGKPNPLISIARIQATRGSSCRRGSLVYSWMLMLLHLRSTSPSTTTCVASMNSSSLKAPIPVYMCVCDCVYVYLGVRYRNAAIIFAQVPCILPGKPMTTVNLQRKIFHTMVCHLTRKEDEALKKMEAY